jgi:hypothetical protein
MSVPPAQSPPATRRQRGRPPVPGTEQRILDTALSMPAESGYAALRLDELARRIPHVIDDGGGRDGESAS